MNLRANRQSFLKEAYNFECKCQVCALPEKERIESEKRREEYVALEKSFETQEKMSTTTLNRTLELLKIEFGPYGVVDKTQGIYMTAMAYCLLNKCMVWAQLYMKLAYDAHVIMKGKDHPESKRFGF